MLILLMSHEFNFQSEVGNLKNSVNSIYLRQTTTRLYFGLVSTPAKIRISSLLNADSKRLRENQLFRKYRPP